MALIYIVEDDKDIRDVEECALKAGNYDVEAFSDADGLFLAVKNKVPDLIVVDIMLPDMDGISIVRRLRADKKTEGIFVVMVTAKDSEIDMIKGLDSGADDYIKKPFSVMELLSRVKTVLRRAKGKEKELQEEFNTGSLRVCFDKRQVLIEDRKLNLTYKEFECLKLLIENKGMPLSRDRLMNEVWGTDFLGETRTVDMHIKTLRQKLGDMKDMIKTVRNVGYVFDEE